MGVIYDPGNMIFEGMENWQMGLELLGPYLSHVHVKNAAWVEDGVVDGARHWRPAVVPMKEGFVSWPRVFAALENVGYQGWISLEDMAQGDTRTKLKDDLEYLNGLEAKGRWLVLSRANVARFERETEHTMFGADLQSAPCPTISGFPIPLPACCCVWFSHRRCPGCSLRSSLPIRVNKGFRPLRSSSPLPLYPGHNNPLDEVDLCAMKNTMSTGSRTVAEAAISETISTP